MSRFQDVTLRYYNQLPKLPDGWTWYIWEDVVDGHEKVFVRLRNKQGHDAGHGTIDVRVDGNGAAVLELARSIRLTALGYQASNA